MTLGTIISIAIIAALLGLAVWSMVRSRKKGECCGGSCKGCSHSSGCHPDHSHKN